MTPSEYLDATKAAIGVSSDYELAQRIGVRRQRISAYRNGTDWPENYVIMQLAIALRADPVAVLADLESQREKRPERAEFWRSFISRALLIAITASTLPSAFTGECENGAGMHGGKADSRYAAGMRIIWHYVSSTLSHAGRRLQEIMKPRDDSRRASPTPKKPASPCGLAQAPGIGARIVAGF